MVAVTCSGHLTSAIRLGRGMAPVSTSTMNWYSRAVTRYYCSDRPAEAITNNSELERRSLSKDLKELRIRGEVGVSVDSELLAADEAAFFPRIKTTSLSTKRVVIHDEARRASVTLVLLAFRRYADEQLLSWRAPFLESLKGFNVAPGRDRVAQIYDVTINETFATQALSGFVQRMQRSNIDSQLHDYHVAFNDRVRDPIENILPLHNRLYGYALLLDSNARVRFRAAGYADDSALTSFLDAAKCLAKEGGMQS